MKMIAALAALLALVAGGVPSSSLAAPASTAIRIGISNSDVAAERRALYAQETGVFLQSRFGGHADARGCKGRPCLPRCARARSMSASSISYRLRPPFRTANRTCCSRRVRSTRARRRSPCSSRRPRTSTSPGAQLNGKDDRDAVGRARPRRDRDARLDRRQRRRFAHRPLRHRDPALEGRGRPCRPSDRRVGDHRAGALGTAQERSDPRRRADVRRGVLALHYRRLRRVESLGPRAPAGRAPIRPRRDARGRVVGERPQNADRADACSWRVSRWTRRW